MDLGTLSPVIGREMGGFKRLRNFNAQREIRRVSAGLHPTCSRHTTSHQSSRKQISYLLSYA